MGRSLVFGITYYNPNNFSVTVKETELTLYLDSTFVGKFLQDSIVEVGEKADFTIPLSGKIPITIFLNFNAKGANTKQFLVKAEGNTKIGKAGIYISKAVKYLGRHRLNQLNAEMLPWILGKK